jgi:branched-chain amino acid transport system substrate-binding protein
MSVGGLFMPLLEYEDVIKLAPQVVFHRVRSQMLGAGLGWNDPRIPAEAKRSHANNAIISAGFQPDMESDAWKHFGAAYKARYNADANRIAALGYDAAQLVIKAVEETGGTDIAKLRKTLGSVHEYNGLSGTVSFDSQTGANSEAVIMKVTETGFMRVH